MLITNTNYLKMKQTSISNGVHRQNNLKKIFNRHLNYESEINCVKCAARGKETNPKQYPKQLNTTSNMLLSETNRIPNLLF